MAKMAKEGKRVVRERFGVDADTCTGDHSCIRLSGCPSLTIKPNQDPLRKDPVATVLDSCSGCGLCGEVAHAAVLCPSFFRAEVIIESDFLGSARSHKVRRAVIGFLAETHRTPSRGYPCLTRTRGVDGERRSRSSLHRCHKRTRQRRLQSQFSRWAEKAAASWRIGSSISPNIAAIARRRHRFPASRSAPARRSTIWKFSRRTRCRRPAKNPCWR